MKKLELEFRDEFRKAKTSFTIGNMQLLVTPPINGDYWVFRIKLHKDQSLVVFPKFGTLGIGFAIEEDNWNSNLPYNCSALHIYNHIKSNKKYAEITKADCMKAISILQKASKYYAENELTPEISGNKNDFINYSTKMNEFIHAK